MFEFLLVLAGLTIFMLFIGIVMPIKSENKPDLPITNLPQYRSRSIGKSTTFNGIANAAARRAMRKDSTNEKYLRQLKQANWYWVPGEPMMPNPKAPFWNVESLWGEKIFGALVYGALVSTLVLVGGLIYALLNNMSTLLVMAAAMGIGGMVGFFMYTGPDGALAGAALTRQRELALEMGFRIPELRGDVMAGNTIQRAIRNMSRRPGGPFVEELRHAVAVLDVTKDDTLAMDQLIERNEGNELVVEFANSLKMVSRQGGQIGPVLNVLADLAQQRLRLSINSQARKNLQEMTRPVGLSSMIVTTLLIIVPAMSGVMGSIGK
jgi:hypothetical protein